MRLFSVTVVMLSSVFGGVNFNMHFVDNEAKVTIVHGIFPKKQVVLHERENGG